MCHCNVVQGTPLKQVLQVVQQVTWVRCSRCSVSALVAGAAALLSAGCSDATSTMLFGGMCMCFCRYCCMCRLRNFLRQHLTMWGEG